MQTSSPWTPTMVEKARWWKNAFAKHDQYIEPVMALKLAAWWDDTESSLLLEGEAGGGKTAIAEILPKIMNAAFYQLQCFKSIGKAEALYSWDEAIMGILSTLATRN